VSDSAGNSDGIGSRFFNVLNTSQDAAKNAAVLSVNANSTGLVPDFSPVKVKKGFNDNVESTSVYPDDDGVIYIEIEELERVEIQLFEDSMSNTKHQTLNLSPLPIGSALDKGVFYWLPVPGFVGAYRFEFIETDNHGRRITKTIVLNIKPKIWSEK
jgi:hypothetical protein